MKLRRRNPMPVPVDDRLESLLADAAGARHAGHPDQAWQFLEDAHVLSQPWVRPHLRVHVAMLSFGWSQRDRTEIVGQVTRLLLAGPGSVTGRYPVGHTGRANVSAFEPMPIRPDLAQLLDNNTVNDGTHHVSTDGVR